MSAPFGQHCYDAPQGYYTAAPRHISSTGLPVMITPNIPIRPNYCQPHYGPNTRSSLISFPFHGNSIPAITPTITRGGTPPKRSRLVHNRKRATQEQHQILEAAYKLDPYYLYTSEDGKRLIEQVGMTRKQVQCWFNNRRSKEKRLKRRSDTDHSELVGGTSIPPPVAQQATFNQSPWQNPLTSTPHSSAQSNASAPSSFAQFVDMNMPFGFSDNILLASDNDSNNNFNIENSSDINHYTGYPQMFFSSPL